ncbi:MAG TPA: hypothetical protein VHH33_02555 [Nitrososphaeraceae archaeon]|nr:hypothetical protein [Nitrososphaeraceae archaeon]
MKRPKPTIKPIFYPEDKLKFIGQKLANPILSEYQKREYIRRFMGGQRSVCHEMPTKIASYDMNGISLIEKYCDKCLKKINLT